MSRSTDMKLHTGSVASTPTIWVEAQGTPVAGITFRVGLADEPLTHRGITGLAMTVLRNELAAAGIKSAVKINAQRTTLYTTGDPIRFVESICAWLNDVTAADFDDALTKAKAKPLVVTPVGEHFRVRFGNVGPGRANLPKLGLNWLRLDHVASWVETNFNSSNAVLWFVGQDLPRTGAALPDGKPLPLLSVPRKGPWETPQWYPTEDENDNRISFSMILEDRPETVVIRNVLEIAVRRTLDNRGIEHLAPETSFDSIGDDLGQLQLSVEVAPAHLEQAMAELRDMLSSMALGGCRQDDLDKAVDQGLRSDGELAGLIAYATRAAFNRLCDRPTPIPVSRDAVYAGVTPAALAETLEAAWTSLIWTSAAVTLAAAPAESDAIAGIEFRAVDNDKTLTVGNAGLRYEQGDQVTSVVWRDIEAVVHVTDDERCLYAKDGPPLAFSSSDWAEGTDLIGDIDRHLPKSRHVQKF